MPHPVKATKRRANGQHPRIPRVEVIQSSRKMTRMMAKSRVATRTCTDWVTSRRSHRFRRRLVLHRQENPHLHFCSQQHQSVLLQYPQPLKQTQPHTQPHLRTPFWHFILLPRRHVSNHLPTQVLRSRPGFGQDGSSSRGCGMIKR